MYLRTVSRKNKNGSVVRYLQLAHNEWDSGAGCAKAKVVYSFGQEDRVDRQAIERLVQSLCRFLSPEAALQTQMKMQGSDNGFLFPGSKRLGGG